MISSTQKNLNPQQEKFCLLYATDLACFGNGTKAYIEAYDVKDNVAQVSASRLLGNAMVCARINEYLDAAGLNTEFVDKQLLFVISQHYDLGQKMNAIKEFNRLKRRTDDTPKGPTVLIADENKIKQLYELKKRLEAKPITIV